MSGKLIFLVGVIYLMVCLDAYRNGKMDISIMFFGYTIAQIGVYMAAMK